MLGGLPDAVSENRICLCTEKMVQTWQPHCDNKHPEASFITITYGWSGAWKMRRPLSIEKSRKTNFTTKYAKHWPADPTLVLYSPHTLHFTWMNYTASTSTTVSCCVSACSEPQIIPETPVHFKRCGSALVLSFNMWFIIELPCSCQWTEHVYQY